jgi:DNA-binding CsgD family transcriptional regulator
VNQQHCDLAHFSNLLEHLYAATLTNQWAFFLNELRELVGANKAFFFLNSIGDSTPLVMEYNTSVEHGPELMMEYQRRYQEDPFYEVVRYAPEGSVIDFKKHLDVLSYKDTDFYQSILVPVKSHHVIASVLFRDGMYESYFSICRDIDSPAFGEAEFHLLQLLTPHLKQAAELYKLLRINEAKLNLSARILNHSGTALLVCDKDRRIIYINQLAQSRIEESTHLSQVNGYLRCSEPNIFKELQRRILDACALFDSSFNDHKSVIIHHDQGDFPLILSISPLMANTGLNELNFPACLININLHKTVDWSALKESYSLTPKELRLTQELYENKKLQQLTEEFSVSYNTLKTQLRSIFAKMQVSSQTELMVVLNQYARFNL